MHHVLPHSGRQRRPQKGFVALLPQQTDRGCKTARMPAVGVVIVRNCRYYRKKHGVTIGVVPIKIEL